MSTFKELAEGDDLDIFINAEEFSSAHEINGIMVNAVFQGLTTKELLLNPRNTPEFDSMHGHTVILHIKTKDMPVQVVHGNVIQVDGEMYLVADVVEDMGITTLTLEVDAL